MTARATEARHGPILLPTKCSLSCSTHAYNRGSIPTPDPRFAGDRGRGPGIQWVHPHPHPRFQVSSCRGSGVHPHHHPRFAGDRGSSPSPVPIGGSVTVPCHCGTSRLPRCQWQCQWLDAHMATRRQGPCNLNADGQPESERRAAAIALTCKGRAPEPEFPRAAVPGYILSNGSLPASGALHLTPLGAGPGHWHRR
jgi:hypothetical protein